MLFILGNKHCSLKFLTDFTSPVSAAIGSTFNPNYTDHKISFKRSLLHLSELISIIFLLPVPHMQSQMLYLHVQHEDETTRHLDATQSIGFNLH